MMKPEDREDLSLSLERTKENVKHQARMAIVAIAAAVVLCFALSVAWYSNILHTSDLTFQAESWDFVFTGNVSVGSEKILAAPGDTGIIPLSVANISDETSRLGTANEISTIGMTVNFDKTDMNTLKERIYFYVDHSMKINNEDTDRQYLGNQDSYLYTIYPGHTLTLSEDYCNDYPIRWQWVYDVVGYYIRGNLQSGIITDPEYIMPIEYDPMNASYDSATGKVITINNQNVDEYIQENYLKKDGFAGEEVKKVADDKYYQVADDVYIYLCNKNEITKNNEIDQTFAKGTDLKDYLAKIILTGVKANEQSYTATTSSDLATAINAGHNLIKLEGNMLLEDEIIVNEGTDVTIDLGGYELTMDKGITSNDGSSLGIINGIIKTDKQKMTLIEATSSEIYLDNLIIDGFYSGIEVYDNNSVEDSHIHISQTTITTDNSVVWLRGNGDKSSRKTSLMIEDSTLISESYIPVGINGTYANYGCNITVISTTLTGKYAGIYQPADKSTMYIKDSTITGMTGIAIKGGDTVIENTTVHGIGTAEQIEEPKYENSGFTNTGSAIYIEDSYVVARDSMITVTINNNVVTGSKTYILSDNANAIDVYPTDSKKVSVIVNGGTYSSDVKQYLPKDNSKKIAKLADGTYKVE